jgi:hypothetical protein
MGTELAVRPACPEHGPMSPRPPGTREQAFCGVWYRCAAFRCQYTHLLCSPGLLAQLDQQRTLFADA